MLSKNYETSTHNISSITSYLFLKNYLLPYIHFCPPLPLYLSIPLTRSPPSLWWFRVSLRIFLWRVNLTRAKQPENNTGILWHIWESCKVYMPFLSKKVIFLWIELVFLESSINYGEQNNHTRYLISHGFQTKHSHGIRILKFGFFVPSSS